MARVTIDIDEDFDEWTHSAMFNTIRDRIRDKVAGVWKSTIRRSSNNHVHIKVYLNDNLSLLESLALRAFLNDDPVRIACDLDRYYRTGDLDQTGRCFDEKYSKGKLRKAGKWERFT